MVSDKEQPISENNKAATSPVANDTNCDTVESENESTQNEVTNSSESFSDEPSASSTDGEKKHTSPKKRLKQIIGIFLGVLVCIVLIAPSIAGYLNVSVISTSGQFTGQDCTVALYEGDVVALLADGDVSNDPEPVKENQIVVGQRTTFNGMNFGTYTLMVHLTDKRAASQVSIKPYTITMWGIDNRQTYEIA